MNTKPKSAEGILEVDPKPQYELSRDLYMQFMEPLGTTDGSVEAAWDFDKNCWRADVINATKELAPPLMRWGGIFSAFYRWREGVGPRAKRVPMQNQLWGGYETNQIGTHEFVDFCRQVGAEPFININFESDGKARWFRNANGEMRSAGATEAAEWVDYCNNPDNFERINNGAPEPFNIKLWEIGNETSYGKDGFDCETAAVKTLQFAQAMHKADPSIELMGWGDDRWAKRMIEVAGEHLKYLDIHLLFGKELTRDNCPITGNDYLKDIDATWDFLMNMYKYTEDKLNRVREEIKGYDIKLALCESHFAIAGRNRGEVLSTWASAVANARILNCQARNGDILKIANLADFCGTRWMVNAIMIPTPIKTRYKAYLMPVALVTALFSKHMGNEAISVIAAPDKLDITASRTGNKIFMHVINTGNKNSVPVRLTVDGMKVKSGKVFELCADPLFEVSEFTAGELKVMEHDLAGKDTWSFPAASVSAVELEVE